MNRLIIGMLMTWVAIAWAGNIKIPTVRDEIELNDGQTIKGTILVEGPRSVVVLVDEKEIDLKPADIKSIRRGRASPSTDAYVTGSMDGMERILHRGSEPEKPRAATKIAPRPSPVRSGAPAKAKSGKGNAGKAKKTKNMIDRAMKDPNTMKRLRELNRSGQLKRILKDSNLLMNKDVQRMLQQLSKH